MIAEELNAIEIQTNPQQVVKDALAQIQQNNDAIHAAYETNRDTAPTDPAVLKAREQNEQLKAGLLATLDSVGQLDLDENECILYYGIVAAHFAKITRRVNAYTYIQPLMLQKDPQASEKEQLLRRAAEIAAGFENQELTPEEITRMYEWEKKTFKIHICVPKEIRVQVTKAVVEATNGQSQVVNRLKAAHRDQNADQPDIVIYLRDTDQAAEGLPKLLAQLAETLKPFSLPAETTLPRFSQPALVDGKTIPGLSFTQGNGDFKAYLQAKGILEKYYDANQHFAVRTDEAGLAIN